MRHQFATVHELARIELLAGIPGESLGRLAERMERRTLAPGETIYAGEDERGRFTVVISGMLRAAGGSIARPGDTLGGFTPVAEPLSAMLPTVVASCDEATFEEIVRPAVSA